MDISIIFPLYSCVYHDQHAFVIFADLRVGVTQGQVRSYCSNIDSGCSYHHCWFGVYFKCFVYDTPSVALSLSRDPIHHRAPTHCHPRIH